jgi:hypothetical protein
VLAAMRNAVASRDTTLRVFFFSFLPPLMSLRGANPIQDTK